MIRSEVKPPCFLMDYSLTETSISFNMWTGSVQTYDVWRLQSVFTPHVNTVTTPPALFIKLTARTLLCPKDAQLCLINIYSCYVHSDLMKTPASGIEI